MNINKSSQSIENLKEKLDSLIGDYIWFTFNDGAFTRGILSIEKVGQKSLYSLGENDFFCGGIFSLEYLFLNLKEIKIDNDGDYYPLKTFEGAKQYFNRIAFGYELIYEEEYKKNKINEEDKENFGRIKVKMKELSEEISKLYSVKISLFELYVTLDFNLNPKKYILRFNKKNKDKIYEYSEDGWNKCYKTMIKILKQYGVEVEE